MTANTQAPDILQQARDAIADRAASRDTEAERSMERTVSMFNALRGNAAGPLSEKDGWQFMECLKMSRSRAGRENLDDYIDGAAYCALAGECAVVENVSPEGSADDDEPVEFLVAEGRLIQVIEGVPDDWGVITSVLLHARTRDTDPMMTVTTAPGCECVFDDADIPASLAADIIAAAIENAGIGSVVREDQPVQTEPDPDTLNLAPAEVARAYREELISLGWVPPGGRELDIPVRVWRWKTTNPPHPDVIQLGDRMQLRYAAGGYALNGGTHDYDADVNYVELTPEEMSEVFNG